MCGSTEMQAMPPSKPTLAERLTRERDRLAARIVDLDTALEALTANPQVQAAVEALARIENFH